MKSQSQPVSIPIPKGDSLYALAKNAEYIHRDLDLAECLFLQVIHENKKQAGSAVKDLAALLHRRGKTPAACTLLEVHKNLFEKDSKKYENLYNTLLKQVKPTGNCENKVLKISHLHSKVTETEILQFFSSPIRIQEVKVDFQEVDGKIVCFSLLKFSSHSAARKTLEGFHCWDKYKVQWVSPAGELMGDAHYARHKMEEYRKHHPTFDYLIFDRDPNGYALTLPLESSYLTTKPCYNKDIEDAEKLLGSELYNMIFKD